MLISHTCPTSPPSLWGLTLTCALRKRDSNFTLCFFINSYSHSYYYSHNPVFVDNCFDKCNTLGTMPVNIEAIQLETLKLRTTYPTLKKALKHAKKILPDESESLVQKYLGGKQSESKESVIARRYSRFSTPAYPIADDGITCKCSGKCATVRRLLTRAVHQIVHVK